MHLKLLLPDEIMLDRQVARIVAEAEDGAFCLLPNHQDFVAGLVPGLFSFEAEGREEFLAVDEGILVKQGGSVLVSVRRAVRGPDLGSLRQTVEEVFLTLDERQQHTRTAMARLEANFARKFFELGKQQYE